MYNYPYGNTSQLNLDWFLQSWRQFQRQVEDMIAPQYNNSATYPAGSIVIYEHVLYTNPNVIPIAEEWDADHWQATSITTILGGL